MPPRDHSMRDAYHRFVKEKTAELKETGMTPKEALAEAREQQLNFNFPQLPQNKCFKFLLNYVYVFIFGL